MEKVLSAKTYDQAKLGGSVTGSLVQVIGEQTVQLDDGRVVEQYIYNIEGYTPQNGKPFAALKANIILL
jgi:hypothetical protein